MAMPRAKLEGSMVVEMVNGERRVIVFYPSDGVVIHQGPQDDVFGPATCTPEAEFRQQVRRVVSRSSYDRR